MPDPPEHDLMRVADAVDQRFPELAPSAPVMLLDEGFGSIVVETARGVIIRIGRRSESFEGYALEHRLLPVVAPLLPVEVPEPRWLVEPCDAFPLGAAGYPKIAGRTLTLELFTQIDQDALANAIARFLVALHHVDTAALPAVPVAGPYERRARDVELYRAAEPALRRHLSPEDYARFDVFWRSHATDHVMMEFSTVMTHGDLWYGNLLVNDEGRLAGVLDWEVAGLGDPARDFAGLKYFGRQFVEDLLGRYTRYGGAVDAGLRARLDKVMVVRELYGIRWALEDQSDGELAEAVEKLRNALR